MMIGVRSRRPARVLLGLGDPVGRSRKPVGRFPVPWVRIPPPPLINTKSAPRAASMTWLAAFLDRSATPPGRPASTIVRRKATQGGVPGGSGPGLVPSRFWAGAIGQPVHRGEYSYCQELLFEHADRFVFLLEGRQALHRWPGCRAQRVRISGRGDVIPIRNSQGPETTGVRYERCGGVIVAGLCANVPGVGSPASQSSDDVREHPGAPEGSSASPRARVRWAMSSARLPARSAASG